MSAPTPVTVVRPYKSPATLIGTLIGRLASPFISALVVWCLTPTATNNALDPSYVRCLAAVLVIRFLLPLGSPLVDSWTRAASKDER